MYHRLRRFFCAQLTILILWPLAAAAQTGVEVVSERSSLGPTLLAASSTRSSDDLPQDTTFLALIKARDDTLALMSELKRITSYHDKLRNGLGLLFASLPRNTREIHFKLIDDELQRLKKLEDDVLAAKDVKTQIDLARKFDYEYPLQLSDARTSLPIRPRDNSPFSRSRDNLNANGDPLGFARRERANANEIFQNVSFANRQFLDGYEKLFSMIDSFGNNDVKAPLLEALPSDFSELAGSRSYNDLSQNQIISAITKYRETLQKTRDSVAAAPTPESPETFRVRLMEQVDVLGQDLVKKSADLSNLMGGLEKNMTLAAKSLYGKAVGGDSFNYLLLVFTSVFLVIMIMPKFYPQVVAENVLKSEFLLQFSTVFVLVAAIIILAIGGFIEKNQLPVLLAGISGYVLGQLGANTGVAPARSPTAMPAAGS